MDNIIGKILALSDALQAGKQLANPVKGKKVQIAAPYFATLVGVVVTLTCGDCISAPDQDTISLGLATLWSALLNNWEWLAGALINHGLTVATTTKLGVK